MGTTNLFALPGVTHPATAPELQADEGVHCTDEVVAREIFCDLTW